MEEYEFNFSSKLTSEDFSEEFQIFVNDYKCPLCNGIYFNPYVDKCGHVFCKECITKYLDQIQQCPITKKELFLQDTFPLVFISEILEKKIVKCKNRNNCCEWTGKLSDLDNHLNIDCKRQIIDCPNKVCGNKIFRENKNFHLSICDFRIINCKYCDFSVPFIEEIKHHETCPKFVLNCTQNCQAKLQRQEMENHLEEVCMNKVIDCVFCNIGCNSTFMKKELGFHLKSKKNEHLLYMFSYFLKSEKKSNDSISKISNFLEEINDKINLIDFVFMPNNLIKLNDVKEIITEKNQENNEEYFKMKKINYLFKNYSDNVSDNLELENSKNLTQFGVIDLSTSQSNYSKNSFLRKLLGNKKRNIRHIAKITEFSLEQESITKNMENN